MTHFLAILALAQVAPDPEVVAGLRSAAIPLATVEAGKGYEDLAALSDSLKGVEVVGMGEPTHGSREVFQFKHRMFEFLVERHGFTVFAIEASLPDSIAMDRFVLNGVGTAAEALQRQGFWTWTTEEVAALLTWMRAYNADPAHERKLRVVGVDMQSQVGATLYFQKTLDELGSKDGDASLWESLSWTVPTTEQWKTFDEVVQRGRALVLEKKGEEEARLYDQVAVVFRQAAANTEMSMFQMARAKVVPHLTTTLAGAQALMEKHAALDGAAKTGLETLSRLNGGLDLTRAGSPEELMAQSKAVRAYGQGAKEFTEAADVLEFLSLFLHVRDRVAENWRDKCMAENLVWARETMFPGAKIMLWAHNGHVARLKAGTRPNMMGAHLAQALKDKYLPVGFAFYEGSFQAIGRDVPLQEWTVGPAKEGSMDAMLKAVGHPIAVFDLRRLDGAAAKWASSIQTTRNYGAVNDPTMEARYYGPIVPREVFDVIVFIEKTTRARPLSSGG